MMHSQIIGRLVFLAVLLTSGFVPMGAEANNQTPTRVSLIAETQNIRPGEAAKMKCQLLDKDNKPTPALKDMAIELDATLPSHKIVKTNIVIKSGQNSWEVSWVFSELGITHITPNHRETINRGTFVMVRQNMAVRSAPALAVPAPATRSATEHPRPVMAAVAARSLRVGAESRQPSPQPPPTATKAPGLILTHGNTHPLADGSDGTMITAFLDDQTDPLSTDVPIEIFHSDGSFVPIEFAIKGGLLTAEVKLTSQKVETVAVKYVRSIRGASVSGDTNFTVQFGPPITALTACFSPQPISLLTGCQVQVTLRDRNAISMATDEPRQVHFTFKSGGGILGTNEIVIPAGQSEGSTTFKPTSWGNVSISAACDGLPDAQADLRVTVPVMPMALSATGGCLGGVVLIFTRKQKGAFNWQRIAIGVVSGFVFYWACLFLNGYAKVPPEIALNPLSAVAISILGGFAGIKVFTSLLKFVK